MCINNFLLAVAATAVAFAGILVSIVSVEFSYESVVVDLTVF